MHSTDENLCMELLTTPGDMFSCLDVLAWHHPQNKALTFRLPPTKYYCNHKMFKLGSSILNLRWTWRKKNTFGQRNKTGNQNKNINAHVYRCVMIYPWTQTQSDLLMARIEAPPGPSQCQQNGGFSLSSELKKRKKKQASSIIFQTLEHKYVGSSNI